MHYSKDARALKGPQRTEGGKKLGGKKRGPGPSGKRGKGRAERLQEGQPHGSDRQPKKTVGATKNKTAREKKTDFIPKKKPLKKEDLVRLKNGHRRKKRLD